MKSYKIETERLIIRCYEPKDSQMLKNAIDESIEHLLPWMPWAKNEPENIEEKTQRVRRFRGEFDLDKDYTFGIFNKEETELIGSTGLHTRQGPNAFEIGYWISKSHINKGYALESTTALTKVGLEIEQKQRIEIHCDSRNSKSSRIPQKLGYTLEATLKNRSIATDGSSRDTMIWTLFKEDYEKSPIKQIDINVFNSINEQIY